MKRNKYNIIILLLICVLSCKNNQIKNDKYVMEIDAMEGQLRYGSFKYPKEFTESYEYWFDIRNEEKDIYYNVKINSISIEKIDKDIDKDILEIKLYNKYYKEYYRKPIKIDKCNAIIVKYEYDKEPPNPERSISIQELCYIQIKKKEFIKIQFKCYVDFYEKSKQSIEEFYKSYKKDLSNPYKTKCGSFIIPDGMSDGSSLTYRLVGAKTDYFIEISYNNPSDGEEKSIKSSLDEAVKAFKGLQYNLKTKKIKVGNKDAVYNEIDLIDTKQETKQKMVKINVPDLNPPLVIEVTGKNEKLFEQNRGVLEAILESFKFDE